MHPNQTFRVSKTSLFFLSLVLFVFIIKGTLLSIIFPFLQGPDEQVHYATLQHLAEPKDKDWEITTEESFLDGQDISTYHFPEETIKSAQATQFDEIKFQKENTQNFSASHIGFKEEESINNTWKRYIDIYNKNSSGTISIYYILGAKMEALLSEQSIFARLFSARFLSVVFGVFVVLIAYLTTKKIGSSEHNSILISSLIAFQPMFSASASQANIDISLILAFSLYIYISVWMLSDGINWKNLALLPFSLIIAFYAKGPGILLWAFTPFLMAYLVYEWLNIPPKKFFLRAVISIFMLSAIIFTLIPKHYLVDITNFSAVSKFDSPIESLSKYIDRTTSAGAIKDTHASYWGNFGWLDTKISGTVLNFIRTIEIIGLVGIVLYLISGFKFASRITKDRDLSYLPEKKYIIFFIGIILALQLGIRFYDWRIFDATKQILIGTPGRYFLPNLIPHILLIVTGLGFFTRNKRQFDVLLKTLAILMILLSLYAMINVIIPRYYL